MSNEQAAIPPHDFDEDCVCRKCGFDGAEHHHWKNNTHEGRSSEIEPPDCY